jgi:hypothetical protein
VKISELIAALANILNREGDVPVYVDTEAGTFPCHMVNVEGVWYEESEKACYLSLDHEVMEKVHL